MKKNSFKIVLFSFILVLICGCLSQPDKKDYIGRPDSCLDFSVCMYYNSKNPDKSICADYAKECRAFGRFNFCKEPKNLPDGVSFNSCMLMLNQK